ncbi:hypothetical protein D3C85_1308180 [compost metagenome]
MLYRRAFEPGIIPLPASSQGRVGDIKAAALTRRQHPFSDQALTRLDDTGLTEQIIPRNLPRGW